VANNGLQSFMESGRQSSAHASRQAYACDGLRPPGFGFWGQLVLHLIEFLRSHAPGPPLLVRSQLELRVKGALPAQDSGCQERQRGRQGDEGNDRFHVDCFGSMLAALLQGGIRRVAGVHGIGQLNHLLFGPAQAGVGVHGHGVQVCLEQHEIGIMPQRQFVQCGVIRLVVGGAAASAAPA